MITEITPKNKRGKYMALLSLALVLGLLFGMGAGYMILDTLEEGDWRLL